jgi:hypothetical protein
MLNQRASRRVFARGDTTFSQDFLNRRFSDFSHLGGASAGRLRAFVN